MAPTLVKQAGIRGGEVPCPAFTFPRLLLLKEERMVLQQQQQGLLLCWRGLVLLSSLPFWSQGAQGASFPLPVELHPFQLLQTASFQNATVTDVMEAAVFLGDVETHLLDSQKIRFLQPWARSAFTPQEWDMLEKIFTAYFIGFKNTINDMAEAFNMSYPLVIQSLIFCEIESNGTKRGFYNAAANGEVMVVFDADNPAWVAQNKDKLALNIQAHLNKDQGTVSILRSLLSNQCIKAVKGFLQTGKATLDRQEVPLAVVFAQESPPDSLLLVCRVTGFYPHLVNVSWLKDEKALPSSAINSTGILPNHDLTYQIRSSLTIKPVDNAHSYACRVEHSSLGKRSLVIPWKKKPGVAVPVIIGILIALLIAVPAIFYWWRKRRHYEGINPA